MPASRARQSIRPRATRELSWMRMRMPPAAVELPSPPTAPCSSLGLCVLLGRAQLQLEDDGLSVALEAGRGRFRILLDSTGHPPLPQRDWAGPQEAAVRSTRDAGHPVASEKRRSEPRRSAVRAARRCRRTRRSGSKSGRNRSAIIRHASVPSLRPAGSQLLSHGDGEFPSRRPHRRPVTARRPSASVYLTKFPTCGRGTRSFAILLRVLAAATEHIAPAQRERGL